MYTHYKGEYWGHKKILQVSHLETPVEVFVKNSGYQQHSRYGLK